MFIQWTNIFFINRYATIDTNKWKRIFVTCEETICHNYCIQFFSPDLPVQYKIDVNSLNDPSINLAPISVNRSMSEWIATDFGNTFVPSKFWCWLTLTDFATLAFVTMCAISMALVEPPTIRTCAPVEIQCRLCFRTLRPQKYNYNNLN